MKKGLCSICCLGYNHAEFLTECIVSIWEQTYRNIEIIAVDDGSSDNSVEILNQLKNKSPFEMTVIAQSNTGNVGKNFNTALKKSQGEFVSFIAMDDKLYPNAVFDKVKSMTDNENIAFAASSYVTFFGEGIDDDKYIKTSLSKCTLEDLLEMEYSRFHSFYIQGSVIRKNALDIIGGFDEDMVGDDIVLRTKLFRYCLESNLNFIITDAPSCYYRRHPFNVSRNIQRQIMIVSGYLKKYWPDRKLSNKLLDWYLFWIKEIFKSRKSILKKYLNFIKQAYADRQIINLSLHVIYLSLKKIKKLVLR